MSLLKANDVSLPFTGGLQQSDTVKVAIPISTIRKANIKLTERLYLKEKVINQEKLIEDYKTLNAINDSTINYYKTNIIQLTEINNSINEQLRKEQERSNGYRKFIICGVTISVTAIIGLIIFK